MTQIQTFLGKEFGKISKVTIKYKKGTKINQKSTKKQRISSEKIRLASTRKKQAL